MVIFSSKTSSKDIKLAIKQYFTAYKEELWKSFVNSLLEMLPLEADTTCSSINTCLLDVSSSSITESSIYADGNIIGEVEFEISLNLTLTKD